MSTVQFSFTCYGVEQMTPGAPLKIIDLSHAWKRIGVKTAGFSFVVVTGWLGTPGVACDERVEIVGEGGQVVAVSRSSEGDKTIGKDGRAIVLTLITIDPDIVPAGRYLVQVFSEHELKLEYPIELQ